MFESLNFIYYNTVRKWILKKIETVRVIKGVGEYSFVDEKHRLPA